MKTFTHTFIFLLILLIHSSCSKDQDSYDASGVFEAEEIIISSEASGTIEELSLQEGQVLKAGQYLGYIDSLQLYLKKKQLEAQVNALLSKRPDISTQLASLREQLRSAEREQKRITSLLKADAATPKQLDDINTQLEVIKRQIAAQRSSLGISSHSITKESLPLDLQIDQIEDQLEKCRIINPVKGTVLAKYAEANEVASPGKPLYKIADLSTVTLRAYLSGSQLSTIKLNQEVAVLVGEGDEDYKSYKGRISWISDKAEFTPKTIQTKDERANLVYAVKINVKNDGFLKLGMYADVKF